GVARGGGFAGWPGGGAGGGRGVGVRVLGARPRLGGRASSFRDASSGSLVDNGQHAMMGCYTRTLSFLDRIGAAGKVHRQPNLHVDLVHPRLGAGAIACPAWPSPLHLVGGLLRYRLLSRHERFAALRAGLGLMAMRRRNDPRLPRAPPHQGLARLRPSAHPPAQFRDPRALAQPPGRSWKCSPAPSSARAPTPSSSCRAWGWAISTPTTRAASSSGAAGACGSTRQQPSSTSARAACAASRCATAARCPPTA